MALSLRSYSPLLPSSHEEHLKFYVNGKVKVIVASGDMTEMEGDAAVVGENSSLTGVGAAARALTDAGGSSYHSAKAGMRSAANLVSRRHSASAKSVFWCDAGGQLPYERIYHAVVPQVHGVYDKTAWRASIAQLYTSVCAEADTANSETSLVAPILGSGVGGGGDFADTVWGALDGIRAVHGNHLKDVFLVDIDRNKALKIASVCQDWVNDQQNVQFNMQCRVIHDVVLDEDDIPSPPVRRFPRLSRFR